MSWSFPLCNLWVIFSLWSDGSWMLVLGLLPQPMATWHLKEKHLGLPLTSTSGLARTPLGRLWRSPNVACSRGMSLGAARLQTAHFGFFPSVALLFSSLFSKSCVDLPWSAIPHLQQTHGIRLVWKWTVYAQINPFYNPKAWCSRDPSGMERKQLLSVLAFEPPTSPSHWKQDSAHYSDFEYIYEYPQLLVQNP